MIKMAVESCKGVRQNLLVDVVGQVAWGIARELEVSIDEVHPVISQNTPCYIKEGTIEFALLYDDDSLDARIDRENVGKVIQEAIKPTSLTPVCYIGKRLEL